MSGLYVFFTRILPALSVLAIVVLLVFAFVISPHGQYARGQDYSEATTSQLVLSVYTIFLHLVSVLFGVRVNLAIGNVIRNVKEAAGVVDKPKRRKHVIVKNELGKASYPTPVFVIIIPQYKEEMQTMNETLRVLAAHPQARHAYHVSWLIGRLFAREQCNCLEQQQKLLQLLTRPDLPRHGRERERSYAKSHRPNRDLPIKILQHEFYYPSCEHSR
jgi:hypothetical protein